MQIPSNLADPFIKLLSAKSEEIRQLFLAHVQNLTKRVPVKVMLADGTVSDQESFDPAIARQFYDTVLKRLSGWITNGVSVTADSDLRRIFIKFEVIERSYALSCHMSIQYHALLFYKPDQRVIDIQKELSEISDKIKHHQGNMVPKNDKIIEERLKQKGYESMDQQKLFEILFEHNDLVQELTDVLQSNQIRVNELAEKQTILFKELDNLLIEIYHTAPAMIDEMKMIAAEEGCLCIFNLEHMKNDTREGNINLARISTQVKDVLLNRMNEISFALKF
jgi:hypothetical protein